MHLQLCLRLCVCVLSRYIVEKMTRRYELRLLRPRARIAIRENLDGCVTCALRTDAALLNKSHCQDGDNDSRTRLIYVQVDISYNIPIGIRSSYVYIYIQAGSNIKSVTSCCSVAEQSIITCNLTLKSRYNYIFVLKVLELTTMENSFRRCIYSSCKAVSFPISHRAVIFKSVPISFIRHAIYIATIRKQWYNIQRVDHAHDSA